MFCPKCGTQVKEDAKFCGKCGFAINTFGNKSITENEPVLQQEFLNTEKVEDNIDEIKTEEVVFVPPYTENKESISTFEFVGMFILTIIPIINVFYLIYTGFMQDENKIKKSYARAVILLAVIGAVMSGMFYVGLLLAMMVL